jgi:hypothetical protein
LPLSPEEFIKRAVSKTRKAAGVERELQREFIERWGAKPITDVTKYDVVAFSMRLSTVMHPAKRTTCLDTFAGSSIWQSPAASMGSIVRPAIDLSQPRSLAKNYPESGY